jgi:peptidoglycan/LPS O-acetylase OafA/YrhL
MLERSWYRRILYSPAFPPLAATLILFCNWSRVFLPGLLLGASVINVLIALLMHYCLSGKSWITELLSTRPLVWVGLLSYSLYLWQQFFLNRHSEWAICSFPVNLLLALAAASASYYMLERPLNGLRRKLRRV